MHANHAEDDCQGVGVDRFVRGVPYVCLSRAVLIRSLSCFSGSPLTYELAHWLQTELSKLLKDRSQLTGTVD